MISPMIGYKVKKNWIKDRNLFILKGRWVSFSLIMCVMMLSFVACHEDQAEEESSPGREEVRVAVVLPLEDEMAGHWKHCLEWAMQNIETAQRGIVGGIRIELEWYDENELDIERLFNELSVREDVDAVIGPFYSEHTWVAARQCAKYNKTLFTISSSAEMVRSFAEGGFLWVLTETDIAQCEVLLSKAMTYGAKRVALLAKEDVYGQTFIDWFAFQAKEFGLEVAGIVSYTDATVGDGFRQCADYDADFMICVPSSVENLQDMVATRKGIPGLVSRQLYSDVAFSATVLDRLGKDAEGLEGIAMSPDPVSGFQVSYEVKFGDQPVLGEAHMYDALCLIAYAAFKMQIEGTDDMNEALCSLVDGRGMNMGSWMAEDMRLVFKAIAKGDTPDIDGATGSLEFDSKVYTNVLHSVYANWIVYDGKFLILDYNTSDGGKRVEETLAGWNWKVMQMQEIDQDQIAPVYPEMHEKWALLVAASTGWENCRHQADVLEIYRLLKRQGYRDDHIVMIMEDDIADNVKNPEPGVIKVRPDGENLYSGMEIDYRLSDLSPVDIEAILAGKRDERLPEVIAASEYDNIFVFWSGHGEYGEMLWGKNDAVKEYDMRKILESLSENGNYRKMLWMVETCYAGSVARASGGIPGVMFITAADENETSKADVFSNKLNVWMSNRFTSTFQDLIDKEPGISIRDLYYGLFQNTVGSHVMCNSQDLF